MPSSTSSSPVASSASAGAAASRPRFTGRAVVLVLVVLVLLVSYASSTKAYLEQRSQLGDLQDRIDTARAELGGLKRERQRWHDEAYVAQQARERFGFVMPGEVGYQVIEGDGTPLEQSSQLTDPTLSAEEAEPAWFQNLWQSTREAGNPGLVPDPVERIAPPRGAKSD
ncbi:septum formation initiator family protein [Nocardioidaceae bacterium]|nr:septum formation initiator family protein [Nocardioidaceae bacterium]